MSLNSMFLYVVGKGAIPFVKHMEKGKGQADSTDDGASDSNDDVVLLQAVSKIVSVLIYLDSFLRATFYHPSKFY